MDASDGVMHRLPVLFIPVGRQHPAVADARQLQADSHPSAVEHSAARCSSGRQHVVASRIEER
jgi:hypothetical protein